MIIETRLQQSLKGGARKGYFRLQHDSPKINCLPSGYTENLADPEEQVRGGYSFTTSVAGNTGRVVGTGLGNDGELSKATITDIPISYGKVEGFQKSNPSLDLKPIDQDALKRTFQKCHATLWAGGKRAPTTAFNEFVKIIFVKIRDEKKERQPGEPYDFQIRTHESALGLYHRIDAIYQEAKAKDPDVFKDKLDIEPEELYTVVEHLQGISLDKTNLDTKGVAFEHFMEDFFKGKSGQFFTPRHVVSFAVKMLRIRNDDHVLDPACGSAGFLLHALDEVRAQAQEGNPDEEKEQRHWQNFAQHHLYGIEINDSIARVAKMNLVLHDGDHTNVIGFDALADVPEMTSRNPGFKMNHFNIIVTNPPFGATVKKSLHPYLQNYTLGQNGKKIRDSQKTEILFIERCIEFLKKGTGKMAIVLPDSIAVNSSLQYVRDYILEHTQALAIVSLPDFAFAYYGANVKSSLLFLRRKGDAELADDRDIFMATAEHIGYTATGKDDGLNDLHVILKHFISFEKTGTLKIDKAYEQKIYLVKQAEVVGKRIDVKGYAPHFKSLKARISKSKLAKLPLADLVQDTQAGEWGVEPSEGTPKDHELCYVLRNTNFDNHFNLNLSDIALRSIPTDKIEKLRLKPNHILVEKSGGSPVQPVGRLALVQDLPEDKPVVFSNFLQKMVIDERKAEPAYVYTYLQSLYRLGYMDYIQNQTTGIKNLLTNDFNAIEVLLPDRSTQEALAKDLITTAQQVKRQIAEARKQLSDTRDGLISRIL